MTEEIEQGSEAWFARRLGKLTASKMGDMLATTKSGPAASRVNLLAQLVCERLTGKRVESWESSDMRRGTELEPLARAAYEAQTGAIVMPAEFIDHPRIPMFGASPDGLIDLTGLQEIKCLNAANHIAVLRTSSIGKYLPQVQTQLLCAEREWCDLCFWHPDFPEHLQMHIVRVHADPVYHKTLEAEAQKFLAEVAVEVKELSNLKRAA